MRYSCRDWPRPSKMAKVMLSALPGRKPKASRNDRRSCAFGGKGSVRGGSLYCMVMTLDSQSNEARAGSRPVRSSLNSRGREPVAVMSPRLVRLMVPISAYIPVASGLRQLVAARRVLQLLEGFRHGHAVARHLIGDLDARRRLACANADALRRRKNQLRMFSFNADRAVLTTSRSSRNHCAARG